MHAEPGNAVVLVVDDHVDYRHLLSIYLRAAGFGTVTAGSAREACAVVQTEPIAAMLTDAHLPGVSGYELLAYFKAKDVGIPAFLMSGDKAVPRSFLRTLGAVGHLRKPVDRSGLIQAVYAAIFPPKEQVLGWN